MRAPLNHQDIKRFNPQRYPLALVDRILDIDPGGEIIAEKAVTATEPCYADVIDEAASDAMAYPVSLMLESFCQAAGPLCAMESIVSCREKVMLLGSIADVEIMSSVYPGEVMTHRLRVASKFSDAILVEGETRVGSRLVARYGRIIVAWRDGEATA